MSQESATSRVPVELWTAILHHAVPIERRDYRMKPLDWMEHFDVSAMGDESSLLHRFQAAHRVGVALMQVCRLWKAVLQPLLLERIQVAIPPLVFMITAGNPSAARERLHRTVLGQPAASYVRYLRFSLMTDSFSEDTWSTIVQVFRLCKALEGLEIYLWDCRGINEAHLRQLFQYLPDNPLRSIQLVGRSHLCASSVLNILMPIMASCRHLVHVGLSRYQLDERLANLSIPLQIIPGQIFPVQSLAVAIVSDGSLSLPMVTTIALPNLKYLELDSIDPADPPGRVEPFLRAYGAGLLSLSINQAKRSVFTDALSFVWLCPRLQDLILCLPPSVALQPTYQLHSLRRLAFSLLDDPFGELSQPLADMDEVVDFISAYCLPSFPHLEGLRWRDVVNGQLQWNTYPYDSDALVVRVTDVCHPRGVRVEDALGTPTHLWSRPSTAIREDED